MATISVIVPVYKVEKYLKRCVDSVLMQTFRDFELILVDDGSPDRSGIICDKYARHDSRIKVIHNENQGVSAARSCGVRNAHGAWLTFLDSDDTWLADYLEKQVDFLISHSCSMVFSSRKRIGEKGNVEVFKPFIVPESVTYGELLKNCPIFISTTIYDREKCGLFFFNENLGSLRDDWVYWLDILKKIDIAYGNKEVLGNYRIRGNSATSNKKKVLISQWKVLRNVEKVGLIRSLYYYICWLFFGLRKYKPVK